MNAAIENLKTNQRQLDADGCMVGVSRQALDETLALVEELTRSLKAAEGLLTDWVEAVRDVGTGWDDWDTPYKAAAYGGNLEALRAVIAKAE